MSVDEHIIHLENGRLASDMTQDRIVQVAQDAASYPGNGGIVIHFHGGLVAYNDGREIANRLLPVYKEQGDGYPVFFIWESGLLETLYNNLGEIAKEKFFRLIWKRIEGIAKRKFEQGPGDRAAFMLPVTDITAHERAIDQSLDEEDPSVLAATELTVSDTLTELTDMEQLALENELLVDGPLNLEIQKISNNLLEPAEIADEFSSRSPRVQASSETLMDPRALDRLVERPVPGHRGILSTAKMIKAIVTITARVISRYVQRRHHGFHATVVEEILRELYLANVGEFIWDTMKQDTVDAFKDDAQVYGGTAFLKALKDVIDPANPPRITLVGHSTGAIYISEFLDKASGLIPDTIKYAVIFLAPASTFKRTADTIRRHRERICDFRMFSMTDEFEKKDKLVKVLYPHSLLYFVSGVVEGGYDVPIVGMGRFYDSTHFNDLQFPNLKIVRDYVLQHDKAVVWSVTEQAPEGCRSHSEKHGDFDNEEYTLDSLSHILSSGF